MNMCFITREEDPEVEVAILKANNRNNSNNASKWKI
jgi:hypothetical protein